MNSPKFAVGLHLSHELQKVRLHLGSSLIEEQVFENLCVLVCADKVVGDSLAVLLLFLARIILQKQEFEQAIELKERFTFLLVEVHDHFVGAQGLRFSLFLPLNLNCLVVRAADLVLLTKFVIVLQTSPAQLFV